MFGDGREGSDAANCRLTKRDGTPCSYKGFFQGFLAHPEEGNMTIRTRSISFIGKGAVLALATTMLVAVSGANPAQAASSGLSQAPAPVVNTTVGERLTDVSARAKKRHVKRHYRRNDAAAAAIFGLAAGAIGTAIADSRRRDYYRQDYYYGGDPYYGRPYYGGPAYYGGYHHYPY